MLQRAGRGDLVQNLCCFPKPHEGLHVLAYVHLLDWVVFFGGVRMLPDSSLFSSYVKSILADQQVCISEPQ